MKLWPILVIVLIAASAGIWLLVKSLAGRSDARGIGIFTMIIGTVGVIVPLFVLMGDSSRNTQLAVLLSGAIIFGCGSIATAIGKREE